MKYQNLRRAFALAVMAFLTVPTINLCGDVVVINDDTICQGFIAELGGEDLLNFDNLTTERAESPTAQRFKVNGNRQANLSGSIILQDAAVFSFSHLNTAFSGDLVDKEAESVLAGSLDSSPIGLAFNAKQVALPHSIRLSDFGDRIDGRRADVPEIQSPHLTVHNFGAYDFLGNAIQLDGEPSHP